MGGLTYRAVCTLVVRGEVARCVFHLVREAVDAGEAVVEGVVALAVAGGEGGEAVHLLLERWQN